MYIQQLYTNCLAEAAYYIESNGEAAIIDPLREITPYLDLAKSRNAKLKYIIETHFHADFVSGHLDLAKQTGASIVYGPSAKANYDIYVAKDGEELPLGAIKLKTVHTPGHTLESSCFILIDEAGKEQAVFTGDTLFVGDVGRPDLAVKSDLSREDLAGMMYDSIQKLLTLADDVIVYPGHGAGSACGKNIGKETTTTIGIQKKLNYALQPMSKAEFVKALTDGLTEPPKYFFVDAGINKAGYEPIDAVLAKNTQTISVQQFQAAVQSGALIVDTRDPDTFEKEFIPGSVNIGLGGQYAIWVGSLIDYKTPLVLICENGKESESVLRLARIGFETVSGILKDGIAAWKNAGLPTDSVHSINPDEFAKTQNPTQSVIDVRNEGEWNNTGVIENAHLITLSKLESSLKSLDKSTHHYVHCAGGYRSMIASSILKKHGFTTVTNIRGGLGKIKEAGVKTVAAAI